MVCPGSWSVAVASTVNRLPSLTDCVGIAETTGGWLNGTTLTAKVSVALSDGEPLSVTTTPIEYTPTGRFESGVHVKTPEAGSRLAPAGAPAVRLYVSVCAG